MAEESQELKDAGLKITLPRIKILQILDSAEVHHVSAEDVYKILLNNGEEIGLATVYRVLTQFEQAGLVVRHNFEGGHSVFEMSSEKHHDHIVCVRCGRVDQPDTHPQILARLLNRSFCNVLHPKLRRDLCPRPGRIAIGSNCGYAAA